MNNKKSVWLAVSATVFFAFGAFFLADKAASAANTLENLQAAYNAELGARARYETCAAKADAEGYGGVAGLFRAAALSESVHAENHAKAIKALGGIPAENFAVPIIKSTLENLSEANKEENNERDSIYPTYVQKAVMEDAQQAVISFKGAMASEGGHARLFAEAMEKLEAWREKKAFLVCRTCGYTTAAFDLKTCPFCAQPRAQFTEVR